MKKIILLFLLIGYSQTYSQVIVEDIANLPHNILTSVNTVQNVAEQVKQYQLMLEEFEIMVQNSAAPYFYVYDQVKSFDENVENLKDRYAKFSDPNEVDKYFKKYYDSNWYRNSPCFKMGGCTADDLDRLSEQRAERIKYITDISQNIKEELSKWTDNQKERYERLKRLDKEAQKAKGHFQIQSYQAQYLSEMTRELTSLNETMKNFMDYMVSLNEKELETGNMHNALKDGYSDYKAPKVKKWNRNFLN